MICEMLDAGYVNVHSAAAGPTVEAGIESVTSRLAVPAADIAPDETVNDCAEALENIIIR